MKGFSKQEVLGTGVTSQSMRSQMVDRLRERGISNQCVLNLISQLPRHLFIDARFGAYAYSDDALPIGYEQTISQIYTVARMTSALIDGMDYQNAKVLEIGTGSGYQTALLASLVHEVYSVERIYELYKKSSSLLARMGFTNIYTTHSDGDWGWSRFAPYDAIMVTAAPNHVPEQLLQQLKIGARMVIPIGDNEQQMLTVIDRTEHGINSTQLDAVKFVPLISGAI